MAYILPKTQIAISDPVPTTASTSMVDGKLRLEFEIDLAPEIGRAVLSGRQPDVSRLVNDAMVAAAKRLFSAVAVARAQPKGEA